MCRRTYGIRTPVVAMAMADAATTFATLSLDDVLAAME